jgi:hypothetical protein
VDTVTEDLIVTEGTEVNAYEDLYNRLRDATLPIRKGLDLLTRLANLDPT